MKFVLRSLDAKLGANIMATYNRTGDTCPSNCMYHPTADDAGLAKRAAFGRKTVCYTNKGNVNRHQKISGTVDALKLRVEIRKFLDLRTTTRKKGATQAKRTQAIRWHVSGDVFEHNRPQVDYVNALVWACAELDKVGVKSLGYTHGWKFELCQPLKEYFMASCDTMDEVLHARALGWMTVLSVSKNTVADASIKLVNCPNQITHGKITCAKCMLCSRNSLAKFTNRVIGFKYH